MDVSDSQPPPPPHAKLRARVTVINLKSRPELNGQLGKVVSWDAAKGRCGVRVGSTNELLALKPDNLEAHDEAPLEAKRSELNFTKMFSGSLAAKDAPDVVWRGTTLPRVFFDLVCGNELLGRLVIELWPDKAPKSAENFRALCTGERGVSKRSRRTLHYEGSRFHALFAGSAVCGGDTSRRADGKGGESIWLEDFEDRSGMEEDGSTAKRQHDRPGIISMGCPYDKPPNEDPDDQSPNKREHPSFGSRFTIYLKAEPLVDGRHPAIGLVLSGLDVLMALSEREVDKSKRPVGEPVIIGACGELPPDEDAQAPQAEPVAVQAEPVAVQAEPVAVQAEPVAVQAEPVAVQAEPSPKEGPAKEDGEAADV